MAWDDFYEPDVLNNVATRNGALRPLLRKAVEVEIPPPPPAAEIESAWRERVAHSSPDGRPIARRATRMEWQGVIAGTALAVPAVLVMLYLSAGWLAAGMGAVFVILGAAIAMAPAWGEVISDSMEERRIEAEIIKNWRGKGSAPSA